MYNLITQTFYAGLTGLDLRGATHDLGHGLVLSPADAKFLESNQILDAPLLSADSLPALIGKPRLALVTSQLSIPVNAASSFKEREQLAAFLASMLRLFTNPCVAQYIVSEFDLSKIGDIKREDARGSWFGITQYRHRYFALAPYYRDNTAPNFTYSLGKWTAALNLYRSKSAFRLLLDSLDWVQFSPNTALSLVAVWGSLEAIFAPGRGQIRDRLSSGVSSYLEKPGQKCADLKTRVRNLYDKRSKGAHGELHEITDAHLLETVVVARRVLLTMIEREVVPATSQTPH